MGSARGPFVRLGVRERLFIDNARVVLTDDAGVSRRVPYVNIFGEARGFPSSPPAEVLGRLRRRVRRGVWVSAALIAGVATVAIALFSTWVMVQAMRNGMSRLWWVVPELAVVFLVHDRVLLPFFRSFYRPVYLAACKAESLCPMCLYSLPSRPTTCPECGARWNADPEPTVGG